ncbi:MAG: AI-2E family transporter [Lachnospiraceae bacterium]|nr:AI-2E family transporter [Lachnospiraceae bacterium]
MTIEWKTCLKIGVSIFLLYLGVQYWPGIAGVLSALLGAAAPLLIGCVVAYIINILMSFYERHYFPKSTNRYLCKSRRLVCMLGAAITLIAVIVLIVALVLPQLGACVQTLFALIPGAIAKLITGLEEMNLLPENLADTLSGIDWKSQFSSIMGVLTSGIGSVMDVVINMVSSISSGVVTGFLSLIFAIYLLLGKDKLKGQFDRVLRHYMKKSWYENTMYVLSIVNDCFRRYIVGQCTEAVILGLLCTVGMLILRLPYAAMIGALIAFTALIPVAGAYIGAGIGAFMILTVSPVKAIIFVVFLVILQQLEGNLIYPRVVGSSMGLPGIWVLAAVTVGGGIMGIMGMLVSVPVTAALYRLLRNDMNQTSARSDTLPEKGAQEQRKKEQEEP